MADEDALDEAAASWAADVVIHVFQAWPREQFDLEVDGLILFCVLLFGVCV